MRKPELDADLGQGIRHPLNGLFTAKYAKRANGVAKFLKTPALSWRGRRKRPLKSAFAEFMDDREFFTPEREAEFNRRAPESEREAAIYPPALSESAHPEFDEVIATFPPEQPF